MSVQKRSDLQTLYGTSGSQFNDNTTGDITPTRMRGFGQNSTDSHFNLLDDKYTGAGGLYLNITDTTGLKAVVTVGVSVNIVIFFASSGLALSAYKLIAGTDAESLPNIVRPTDYDGSSNQKVWKLISISASVITNDTDVKISDQNDFTDNSGTALPYNWISNTANSANLNVVTTGENTTEHCQGVVELNTSATTNGRITIGKPLFVFGNGHTVIFRERIAMSNLSDGTNTFSVRQGFVTASVAGNASELSDGIFFRYTHSVNSGKWECVTRTSGVETATDSGISPSATVFDIMEIRINSNASSVGFYINGTLVATNTTNIPSAIQLTYVTKIEKSAGTTARNVLVDWYDMVQTNSAR